ncbi:hypothetical protein MPH_07935 [Macrophomina phaseolina MS6]|uniref:Uncharacterized protein n=1 Tax=Macrophomina phaseolina (strain MS6) TaxID=1126212 RepID=K2SDF3_MACPH|nr:hypothetical protein MPH_07935 [Macrophomina phaseolina MS6]
MEFSQTCEWISTRSTTPEDGVFSTPGSSFFGRPLVSSPRIDSTPPTSEFVGSGHETPVLPQRSPQLKSLHTPWGIGLGTQDIKLESSPPPPPPSSQLPAAYDFSPTPTPKSKRGTPNAVRGPPCCQTNFNLAKRTIESAINELTIASSPFPGQSRPDDAATPYDRWATIVRNALVDANMWKFVDSSHSAHSSTLFYRNADLRTVELIRWAYTTKLPTCDPPTLNDTLHMPASELWDTIRARHTCVLPASSSPPFSTASSTPCSLPPISSAPSPPSDRYPDDASKSWALMQRLAVTTMRSMGPDCRVVLFANQLQTIAHRMQKFGFLVPEYQLKMQFLKNLEPEFEGKVRELEAEHGLRLWNDEGVGFVELREWVEESYAGLPRGPRKIVEVKDSETEEDYETEEDQDEESEEASSTREILQVERTPEENSEADSSDEEAGQLPTTSPSSSMKPPSSRDTYRTTRSFSALKRK